MLYLGDIIDYCRAEALAGKLYPTDTSDWRWFCREYSKTFHTPLHLVLAMEPEHVILCVLEDGLDGRRLSSKRDVDSIINELRRLEDPNYDSTQAKEMDDWAVGIEQWDANRVTKGAPVPTKKTISKVDKPLKELPKEGGINLAYLSKEEESNQENGFEDDEA